VDPGQYQSFWGIRGCVSVFVGQVVPCLSLSGVPLRRLPHGRCTASALATGAGMDAAGYRVRMIGQDGLRRYPRLSELNLSSAAIDDSEVNRPHLC
jgi:hypothetical protein